VSQLPSAQLKHTFSNQFSSSSSSSSSSDDDDDDDNNNNSNSKLQLRCHPVAVVILHVYKI
jgi:hypothetical protein